MTEDEAFIRAVVDSPGDDTPRLVYADWLDDRGDPRGPYLRAEREAVRTGDVAELRELAAGLDPVWVARVSLPPVGVCVADAAITSPGPAITAADLDTAERRLGFPLPAAYRAFLLNYNGCAVQRVWGEVDGEVIPAGEPLTLLPLISRGGRRETVETWAVRHREWLTDPVCYITGRVEPATAATHRDLTPVGTFESCRVFLWVRGPAIGAVCYGDILGADLPDPTDLRRDTVGRSFADFLAWFLRLAH